MSKTEFEADEKGIALKKAQETGQPFFENTDGTSYVSDGKKKVKRKKIKRTRK